MPARVIHPICYTPLSSLHVRVNVSRPRTLEFPVSFSAASARVTESTRNRIEHRLVLARLHRRHRRTAAAKVSLQISLLATFHRALNQPLLRLSSFVDGDSLSNCQVSFLPPARLFFALARRVRVGMDQATTTVGNLKKHSYLLRLGGRVHVLRRRRRSTTRRELPSFTGASAVAESLD